MMRALGRVDRCGLIEPAPLSAGHGRYSYTTAGDTTQDDVAIGHGVGLLRARNRLRRVHASKTEVEGVAKAVDSGHSRTRQGPQTKPFVNELENGRRFQLLGNDRPPGWPSRIR